MKTTACRQGQVIDCRVLSITGEFHTLSETQINELAKAFFDCVSDRFSDECYIEWSIEKHKFSDVGDALEKHKRKNGCFSLLFNGDIKSDIVYSPASFRKNERALLYSDFQTVGHSCSADYIDYYNEHIAGKTGEDLRQSILSAFNEPKKVYLQNYLSHDIQGTFFAVRDEKTGPFYGEFLIAISVFSLEEELDSAAEYFSDVLRKLSFRFSNINARIMLAPLSLNCDNFYSAYFGRMPSGLPLTPANSAKWSAAQYKYLRGIGWFNIVSPTTRALISKSHYAAAGRSMLVCNMENGALSVGCVENISKADVGELKDIKALLYTSLLPGESTINLEAIKDNPLWSPRSRWEMLPVFDDEVTVTESEIIFKHTKPPQFSHDSGG